MRKSFACLLVGAICVGGCAMSRLYDVTDQVEQYPELRKSYVVGAIYETKERFALKDVGGKYLMLDDLADCGIIDVAEAARHPKAYPRVKGIVDAGTVLRIVRLEYEKMPTAIVSGVDAVAEILDGEYRGVPVNLAFISLIEFGAAFTQVVVPDANKVTLRSTSNAPAARVAPSRAVKSPESGEVQEQRN